MPKPAIMPAGPPPTITSFLDEQPIAIAFSVARNDTDPSQATGSEAEIALAFADAYRQLNNRITLFCALPMNALDRLSLQRRLDEIGRTTLADDPAA